VALSVSALVLFGVMLIIFIRGKAIKWPHAIVAVLFGFMLNQSTQLSKPIQDFLTSVANTLGKMTN
jgi:intracellular septation protein A